MADFVAVLKKTIDGMGETTPQMRERVYDKARSTIAAKLAAIDPPPPATVAERQKRTLEDAIAAVEKEYARPAPPAPASDPLAELESIFSSIDRNKNTQNHVRPLPPARTEPERVEPARQTPAAAPVPASASRPAERVSGAPSSRRKPSLPGALRRRPQPRGPNRRIPRRRPRNFRLIRRLARKPISSRSSVPPGVPAGAAAWWRHWSCWWRSPPAPMACG